MYPHRHWDQKELSIMREMWLDGTKSRLIAERLKRTVNSIRNQAMEIGLPKRERSGTPKNPGSHRLKSTPDIAQLKPRNGNFDSSRALSYLIDHWGRKAA